MHPLSQYFKPAYRAYAHFCQLCGAQVEEGQFVTEKVRAVEARMVGGADYLICVSCNPIADRVVTRLKAEEDRLDKDHEEKKAAYLRELGTKLCEEMKRMVSGTPTNGARIGAEPAAPKAQAPAPKKARKAFKPVEANS